ncbi:MAG: HAMP domain-containing protein [Anaerolineales bacterium]|nr:HAMP domain-containing protein [Anaerolineales bacterium]
MNPQKFQSFSIKIWEILGAVSIRTKIFGIVLGSTLLLSIGFALQTRLALQEVLEQKSQEQGISIAQDLASSSTDLILVNDLYALHQLLEEVENSFSDVRYAFVLDPEGYVLAHTFGEGFPIELLDINPLTKDEHHSLLALETNEGIVWDVAESIFDGRAGTARVGISSQSMQETLAKLTTQLGLTVLGVLGVSLLAATLLTWILTRPILELVDATLTVGGGDFSVRVQRWANDEIGDLAEAFNQMTMELGRIDEIRAEREKLRRQLIEGMITAQEDERRRIARELHDSTSQSLTSLKVGLRALETICDRPETHHHVVNLRHVLNQTLEEVREMAIQLRPAALDDLGLTAALERYLANWQTQHDINVDCVIHTADSRLPEYVETAVYRIVQESLTNVARHAEATSVSVLVERRTNDVITVIEDDGKGFDESKAKSGSRLGLLGMRERTELLGGKLTIESTPQKGTSLFFRIPIGTNDRVKA